MAVDKSIFDQHRELRGPSKDLAPTDVAFSYMDEALKI